MGGQSALQKRTPMSNPAASPLPTAGTYARDSQGRITADPDGNTYTYDDTNGGRIATQTRGGVTRTFTYDANGMITGAI